MNMKQQDAVSKTDIARSFGQAAVAYDQHAKVQQWACEQLYSWLPSEAVPVILDLGAGTGAALPHLINYCSDRLIAMDLSEGMMRFASERFPHPKVQFSVGDAELTGLGNESVDIVFSSLMIQWSEKPERVFKEIYRILKPGGCVVFSTLVEGSLQEVKRSWMHVNEYQHVNQFLSQQEISRAISQQTWEYETLDVKDYVLHYSTVKDVMRSLKGVGAHNMTQGRSKTLTGVGAMKRFIEAYEALRNGSNQLPLTYRVGLGHLSKPK